MVKTDWAMVFQIVNLHMVTKYKHLSDEDIYFRWSTMRHKWMEALEDGVISKQTFDAAAAVYGEQWIRARND